MKTAIFIACGESALPFLPMCFESLQMQTRRPDYVFLSSDCKQYTARAQKYLRIGGSSPYPSSPRFVLENTMLNFRLAKEHLSASDIVVILDGDDWLCRRDALEIVYNAHDSGAWVTYGSWVSNSANAGYPSRLPPYPKNAIVRKHPWLATSLRSFRYGLLEKIKDADLRDEQGRYYTCCPDLAIMFPAIEMAGWDRVRHIPEPIYFYNRDSGGCVADTRRSDQIKTEARIRSLGPYDRIEAL